MLSPKRVKYRKQQKGRMNGLSYRGSDVSFGEFALQATGCGRITARQLEIRIFPDKPITKKPAETRMGKGKGAPELWVAVIQPGRVLYEIEGVAEDVAMEALRRAGHKLPLEWRVVKREGVI